MAFCLDNAEYAAPLARRLATALNEPGLKTHSVIARLYLISDVLVNSSSSKQGASKYLTSFQDLLPEAFEQMGREWFRRLESLLERSNVEQKVRGVLAAWRGSDAMPPLFTRGLEALVFAAPAPEVSSPDDEPDVVLRRKLARWFSAADQARLPYACRLRGLAGRALATAACRARLCHYERYWHRPGVEMPGDGDEDLFGDARHAAPIGSGDAQHRDLPEASSGVDTDDDEGSLNGEPLTHEEIAALEAYYGDTRMDDMSLTLTSWPSTSPWVA